jgi:hypothetical protein
MSDSNHPRIAFSERLSIGIVVHFEDGTSVLFSAPFLYEHRNAPPNRVLLTKRDPDPASNCWLEPPIQYDNRRRKDGS